MQSPLFSIIMPAWNADKTIRASLDSIVNQKFTDFEVLIMDGLSTDLTVQIVQSYAVRNPRIRWISEKDNGIFDAMNKGIQAAKGEWVYFMGSDDSLINDNVLGLIAGNIEDKDEIIYGNSVWLPANFDDHGPKSYLGLLQEGINHQRVFYKKELFTKYGFYNVHFKFASDLELNNRFFCNPAIQRKYVNVPVANFHAGGISAQHIDEELWKNWKSIIVKNFKPYLPNKQIYRRLSWYCWFILQKKKYREAGVLFCNICFYTLSFTFVRHTMSQVLKLVRGKNNS